MVVVVAGVHVEGRLGHGARADVENVGQPLAGRRVERLVHVRDALSGGEVGGTHARHRHASGDGRRSMLAFGLDEDERPIRDVDVPGGGSLGPVLAHLRRRCDRVGACGITRFALAHDDRGVAIERCPRARVFDALLPVFSSVLVFSAEQSWGHGDHQSGFRLCVQVGASRSVPLRMIFLAAGPLTGPASASIQTIAPVGQRSIGARVWCGLL